jgi:hypothetical protein
MDSENEFNRNVMPLPVITTLYAVPSIGMTPIVTKHISLDYHLYEMDLFKEKIKQLESEILKLYLLKK